MELGPEALRSISHDMRNLLTAVRGHAELALRGLSPDDPAREDVAHAVVVTAALFELIDQLDGARRHAHAGGGQPRQHRQRHAPPARRAAADLGRDAPGARFGGRPRDHLQAPRRAHRPQPGDERPRRHGRRRRPLDHDQPRLGGHGATSWSRHRARASRRRRWSTSSRPASRPSAIVAAAATGSPRWRPSCDGAGGTIEVDSRAGEGATVIVTLPLAEPSLVPGR